MSNDFRIKIVESFPDGDRFTFVYFEAMEEDWYLRVSVPTLNSNAYVSWYDFVSVKKTLNLCAEDIIAAIKEWELIGSPLMRLQEN